MGRPRTRQVVSQMQDDDAGAPVRLPDILTNPDRPEPESSSAKLQTRALAVAALAVSVAYLVWRAAFTLNPSAWWLSVPLLLLEIHAVAGLALFAFSLWDLDSLPPAPPCREAPGRIAVLIPTYNEPVDVLLPTVAAAVALEPAHETWVLDDGNRPAVRRLASQLGVRYLARSDRAGAKAGNVNHALSVVAADFVAILDADHVASRDFLVNTLGYFTDPEVAFVQTPQDFYNTDSFEHEHRRRWWRRGGDAGRQAFSEQALFYRVLQPGKNRWKAAFWCGTGAVIRVEALRQVGGVATETVTEDIHTTIRMHKLGWRSVYHNEVLARGLAAADAGQYQLQRLRWGRGAMQVLASRDNPLVTPGLRPTQRLAYATTLLGWFDAWRSLGYVLLPPAVLLSGVSPIQADSLTFVGFFSAAFLLQRLALVRLARGRAPHLLSTVFEFVRMSANLGATLTLFGRRAGGFAVTPKGRVGEARRRHPVPLLLRVITGVSVLAGVWFALTLFDLTPLHYGVKWVAYSAFMWLVINGLLIAAAMARIRSERFAGERRASVRFDLDAPGHLDGRPCRARDLSLTGAGIVLPGDRGDGPLAQGQEVTFTVDVDPPITLQAEVRSVRTSTRGTVVGLQFVADQDAERANLALALFHSGADPERIPARPEWQAADPAAA
jgi:cellulose synthase/poly-beta-1,6-N-acetylglucosamine synthase-like glycosyltransferase